MQPVRWFTHKTIQINVYNGLTELKFFFILFISSCEKAPTKCVSLCKNMFFRFYDLPYHVNLSKIFSFCQKSFHSMSIPNTRKDRRKYITDNVLICLEKTAIEIGEITLFEELEDIITLMFF